MTDTKKLKDMLDNLINNKPEQAQVVFHDYLKTKLNGVLGTDKMDIPPVIPAHNIENSTN